MSVVAVVDDDDSRNSSWPKSSPWAQIIRTNEPKGKTSDGGTVGWILALHVHLPQAH